MVKNLKQRDGAMKCITVKNNVTWVGKIDWDLRKFHGNE
jgi:flavorubredoxin